MRRKTTNDLVGFDPKIAGKYPLRKRVQEEAKETMYCVIYRVGGRDRFEWKRTLAMPEAEAIKAAFETMRMGYPVLIEKCKRVDALGLPETFDVRDAVTL